MSNLPSRRLINKLVDRLAPSPLSRHKVARNPIGCGPLYELRSVHIRLLTGVEQLRRLGARKAGQRKSVNWAVGSDIVAVTSRNRVEDFF